ncbi:hypothetical protein B0J14DRAFT_687579 [Halenospora varia]|nr:hypothetical protein B0J14DRAFT_687579 [Halenospora varia]
MLATHPSAKRKIIADISLPALDLDTFESNARSLHNPTLPHKRTRLSSQPHQLTPEWSWTLATDTGSTVYNGHEPCTLADTAFPSVPPTSFPYYLNSVAGATSGDMPAKRRQHLPGINPPRLATTWRETTSSRGIENPFKVGVHEKTNNVTPSMSNVPPSNIANDGLESRDGLDITDWEPSSVFEFNGIVEQQNEDSSGLTGSEPYVISSCPITEMGQVSASNSIDQFLSAEYNLNNLIPFEADSDNSGRIFPFTSHQLEFDARPEGVADGSKSIGHNAQNSSYFEMPGTHFGGYLLGDSSLTNNDLGILRPRENIQEPTNPRSEMARTLERGDIDLETGGIQSKSSRPEINGHLWMGHSLPEANYSDLSNWFPSSLPRVPSKKSSVVWPTNECLFLQPSVSTPSFSCVGTNLDGRGNKMRGNVIVVEEQFNLKKPAYPSRALQSLGEMGANLSSSTSLPIEQLGGISSDPLSNKRLIDTHNDWLKGIDSHENIDRNALNKDTSLRMQNVPEISTQMKPQAGPRFSIKSSNLRIGGNTDTPVLVVVEDTNATQQEVQEFLAKTNQPSRLQKRKSSSNSPSRKVETSWEHTFIPRTHFTEAEHESPPRDTTQKLARRTRPLTGDTRAKAKQMRRMRACLRCRVAKISCDPGEICIPCLKAQASMLPCKLCVRAHLKDYLSLFLPERAVRPFQKAWIDQVMENKISGYGSSEYKVCLSSGPSYPPILVTVQAFRTKDPSFSVLKKIVPENEGRAPAFVEFYSPPLGITDFTQDLDGKLRTHIQGIVGGERNFGEVSYGNTSRLTWDVHEAVRLYQWGTQASQLLRKSLKLYAMQFFMTKTIVLLRSEPDAVLEHLPGPSELNIQKPNLRIISIQIKHVMYSLIRDTYAEVLEELEESLRPKDLASWAPSFCCILILCMCAEMVQITTDHRVVCALDDMSKSEDGRDKNGNTVSQEDSYDVCHKLDDLPIASAESNFHATYKSFKLKDSTKREQGFNPIRDGLDAVRKAKLGLDVEEFVGRILDIVAKYRVELIKEVTIPSLERSPDIVEVLKNHSIFRKHNSGRLVSRFLQSML